MNALLDLIVVIVVREAKPIRRAGICFAGTDAKARLSWCPRG